MPKEFKVYDVEAKDIKRGDCIYLVVANPRSDAPELAHNYSRAIADPFTFEDMTLLKFSGWSQTIPSTYKLRIKDFLGTRNSD